LTNVTHYNVVKLTTSSPTCSDVELTGLRVSGYSEFNSLNAELNPICHLLALLEAHHILHVSRIRVKWYGTFDVHFPCNFVTYVKSNTNFVAEHFYLLSEH